MVATQVLNEINNYINDVNVQEIASQIASNNLDGWIKSWSKAIKDCVVRCFECYNSNNGWIFLTPKNKAVPPQLDPVQILVLEDCGDQPFVYSETGWTVDNVWISHDGLVEGQVVAWQPLAKELSLKRIREEIKED